MRCVVVPTERLISVNSQTPGMLGGELLGHGPCPRADATLLSCVPSLPPASVCADNHPNQLRCHLAMYVPPWLAIFPDWIHDFSDCSLHKFLHSDLQQEGVLPEARAREGPPERVRGCERTHQPLFLPGEQCEAEEATEGLKPERCGPPNHVA